MMYLPALLDQDVPKDANCLKYIEKRVRKVAEQKKDKQNARMEITEGSEQVNSEREDAASDDDESESSDSSSSSEEGEDVTDAA